MTRQEFKQIRKDLGLTQAQYASALGFNSGRYIRALEKGERSLTTRTVKLVKTLTGKRRNENT